MYYRLKPPNAFRGWRKLPFAIRAEYGENAFKRAHFYKKALFMELLCLNGVEDVDPAQMSEEFRRAVDELIEHDLAEKSEEPLGPLEPWQHYRMHPARYAESAHGMTEDGNFLVPDPRVCWFHKNVGAQGVHAVADAALAALA